MKKYILLLLSLLIFLSACTFNFKPSNNSQPVVGFSQSGTESTWRKRHTDSITTELEKGYQFEREGYFCADNKDSRPEHLVFNLTVSLKEGF